MGTAILLLGVVAVLFLLFRIFYTRMRWYLSDIYPVLLLCSLPPLFVGQQLHRNGLLEEPRGVLYFAVIILLIDAPVFMGAWWGLYSAQRLNENRTWARLALIISGILAFPGAVAGILFLVAMMFSHPGRNPEMFIVAAAGSIAIALLLYPAWRVEQACRRRESAAHERATRRPEKPALSESPESAASPSSVQNQTSTPRP